MKKSLRLSLLTMAAMLVSGSASADNLPTRSLIYDVPDGEANLFGYLAYDTKYRTFGFVNLQSQNPGAYSLTKDYGNVVGQTPSLQAGTFVGDEYIVYEATIYQNAIMPRAFSAINPLTGELTTKREIPSTDEYLILNEMTYDPKTKRLFGMHYNANDQRETAVPTYWKTDIYEISTVTYALTKVATIDMPLYTMSADNGYIYGITPDKLMKKTQLVRIDQSTIDPASRTCTVETVSPSTGTGVRIGDYTQSMEFDKTTHRLWWVAQTSDGGASLVEIDPATGLKLSATPIQNDPQLLAVAIPYQYVADEAPSYVHGFKVKADPKGALQVQMEWDYPMRNYRLGDLQSIDGAHIYRDGQLVGTHTYSATDDIKQWTDRQVAEGEHVYRIAAYNQAGEGVYKEARVYVGEDTPGAPLNIRVTTSGPLATITWDAPETGAHAGYYNAATLSYDVTRLPDNVVVATGTTDRKVEDKVPAHAGYSYVVTAKNNKGVGLSATSQTIAFGGQEAIPFASALDSQIDFDRWTVINANGDAQTWTFRPTEQAQASYTRSCAMYDRSTDLKADDWLVSPPLTFDASKTYQIRYTYATANWVTQSMEALMEKMQVAFGHQASADALTTIIDDPEEFHTSSGFTLSGKKNFKVDKSGEGFIAFHALSEAMKSQIYINDVSLREYSATDLSARELKASATANCNVKQYSSVIVGNEGSAAVDNYQVEIVDANTGEVLGTQKGLRVEKDTTVSVAVGWTPTHEGKIHIIGRVVLDGDTYPADNVAPQTAEVMVAAETAERWLTLDVEDEETYGWNMPFYVGSPYSQVQALFLESDMSMKDIDLTGIRFFYDGHMDGKFVFPARISMKRSDRTKLCQDDNQYRGDFDTEEFTQVFDGQVAIVGNQENTLLEIPFDQPYRYTGGNLLMKFESLCGSNTLPDALNTHPVWSYSIATEQPRAARMDGADEWSEDVWAEASLPYVAVAYKSATGVGTIQLGHAGQMAVALEGGRLLLPATCDHVALYSQTGALVAKGLNTSQLGISGLPAGLYLLRATVQGQVLTQKVVIR